MANRVRQSLAFAVVLSGALAFAEHPYAFRNRLLTVHRTDRRDFSRCAAVDEYAFVDGAQIVVADGAPDLLCRAAEDFREYLLVSMGVNASVRAESDPTKPGLVRGVTVRTGRAGTREFEIAVGDDGVKIDATDARMAAQALYSLEDRMNFRKGPFLKKGSSVRRPMFDHRFTFSGYGDDLFPDAHLNQIAHHGFTGIEIWLSDYDVISQGQRQDVNDLIARAAKFGLETKRIRWGQTTDLEAIIFCFD